ncbi:MAG: cob(I)yrinic acid a,c-diamide adenosyltransferase [Chlorobi bacterium]|nr:cob(I)yrinic acid a,c-diamide adenosyltransferase [Chlorobiota bacterium]
MKIYTKKGDSGKTSLLTGKIVSKSDIRIDAYGTVDELNSFVGLLRDYIEMKELKDTLLIIQNNLFIIGSHLASDKIEIKNLPELTSQDISFLENSIDEMQEKLTPLTYFILPGGHKTISYCHVARSICRRAERLTEKLSQNETINPQVIKYLNRLSDFLFVFARLLAKELNIVEIKWEHKLNK